MKNKRSIIIEIEVCYIAVLILVAVSNHIVAFGNTKIIKMILTILVYAALVAIPYIISKWKHISLQDFGYSNRKIGQQLLVAGALFAILFCITILAPILLGVDRMDVLSFKSSSKGVLIFYLVCNFFCVGFGEEFIFRGYFYQRIKTATDSEWIGIALSSVLFGLWHYPNGRNIMQVIMTTVIGLIYGIISHKTKKGTVLSTSVAHGLHDVAIVALSYIML
ncbi:MAG: type II CAAX endopeptidase family protein [Mobilitalea sp.]